MDLPGLSHWRAKTPFATPGYPPPTGPACWIAWAMPAPEPGSPPNLRFLGLGAAWGAVADRPSVAFQSLNTRAALSYNAWRDADFRSVAIEGKRYNMKP